MQSTTVQNVVVYRDDVEGYTAIGNHSTNRQFEPLIEKYDPFLIISQSKQLAIMRIVAKKNEYASPETYFTVVKDITDNTQPVSRAVLKTKQQLNDWGYTIDHDSPTKSVLSTFNKTQTTENTIPSKITSHITQSLTSNRVILGVNNPFIAMSLTRTLPTTHSTFITTNYNNIPLPKSRLIISIDEKHNGITKIK